MQKHYLGWFPNSINMKNIGGFYIESGENVHVINKMYQIKSNVIDLHEDVCLCSML